MHNEKSRLTNYLKVFFSFLEKTMNDRTNLSKGYSISLIGAPPQIQTNPKNMFFGVKWAIISKNSHFFTTKWPAHLAQFCPQFQRWCGVVWHQNLLCAIKKKNVPLQNVTEHKSYLPHYICFVTELVVHKSRSCDHYIVRVRKNYFSASQMALSKSQKDCNS